MASGNIFSFGYFGNLIRRWIKDSPPFYPLYANFFLNRKMPILIDTNNLMTVYLQSPILRAIIDKKAEMMMNMKVQLFEVDSKGNRKEILDHPVLQLLENPNPLQSFEDFIAQYSTYKDIYANAFVYKLRPYKGATPKILWLLPPGEMKIIPTGKLFQQSKIEDIIEKYEMYNSGSGQPFNYEPTEVVHVSDGTSDKYFFGESKILTNKITISNIQGALKTRNILINDKGAMGILSNEGNDGTGGIPLGDDEKKQISDDYQNKYGINDDQARIIMTTAKVKWQPMSYPTKDLMLFEEIEDSLNILLGEFGLDRDLFPSTKGATFENKAAALRQTYQNTIQQEANVFLKKIKQDPDFGIQDRKYVLEASFSHLPVMQEDEEKKASSFQKTVTSIASLVSTNVINPVQAQKMVKDMTGVIVDETLKNSNPIIDKLTELSPLVANHMLGNLTVNEVRGILGLVEVPDGDVLSGTGPTAITKPQPDKENSND